MAAAGITLAATRRQLETVDAAKAVLALSYSTLQTQADEWQTQLAAAITQNAQLAGAVTAAQQETGNVKAKLVAAQTALDAANERLARSMELIALFNQLEGVGLDNVVSVGLGVLAGALSGVAGPAAGLRDGVSAAQGLLADFEQTLPDFSGAMAWLGEQVVKTKVALWAVETSAQHITNSTLSGLTAIFGGFVGSVLGYLPFNLGANVRNTLSQVQNLLEGVTALADQAPDQGLLKISHYVDDTPTGLAASHDHAAAQQHPGPGRSGAGRRLGRQRRVQDQLDRPGQRGAAAAAAPAQSDRHLPRRPQL